MTKSGTSVLTITMSSFSEENGILIESFISVKIVKKSSVCYNMIKRKESENDER